MKSNYASGWLLEQVSLVFVFLPCFLFLLGWMKWVYGVPCALVLAAGLFFAFRSSREPWEDPLCPATPDVAPGWRPIHHGAIVGLVVLLVLLSGIGGYGYQVPDYAMKHNSFLKDFMDSPWPIGYKPLGASAQGPLVTYFAFYLPHAFVGKFLGWEAANFSSLLWSILGVYLCVAWFLRLVGSRSFWYAALFLFFGGLDIIGWMMVHDYFFMVNRHLTLDFWLGHGAWADELLAKAAGDCRWYYFSNMAVLYQCVHHLLPGGVVVLMTFHQAMRRRTMANTGLLWAALPTGSVLVALGMMPFLLVSLLATRGRQLFTFQNLAAAPMLAFVSFLFFHSNNADYPHGWIWHDQSMTTVWIVLFLFFIIEFGAYLAACPALENPGTRPDRLWLYAAVGTMVLFSLYRLGVYNDLAAKAAIPSLLLVQVYIACTIRNASTPHERQWVRVLVFLLFIGAFSAFNEVSRALEAPLRTAPPPVESIRKVTELPQQGVAIQLFGDPEAFFWKHLAKPVHYN